MEAVVDVAKAGEAVDPDELFEKLKPFKDRVEEDIEQSDG